MQISAGFPGLNPWLRLSGFMNMYNVLFVLLCTNVYIKCDIFNKI